ncbi:hypothetical protein K438DRAFT_2013353 [Mycena galopus ATCC 62051]|nr:hypothetical protein K438DRAFT_2013353 [Mycena galopus ATCC 62051]
MPRLPTAIEIRIDNITACLTPALLLLTELNDAFGPPFVQSIANTIQSLINMVQNVKRNKIECAQLMEPIHQIVYGILNLHVNSETVGCLSPSMLDNIGTFMEFFVSAEAAATSIELAALIGLHLGLNPGLDLTKAVVQYLACAPPSLLILDNLETVWEPRQTRAGVERLLCLLAELENLALMVTMRGAERPGQVQWTHPFLLPLQPLSRDAAQKTFMDITDNAYTLDGVKQLLRFTGNMPLAVDLIAHLTDYEGLPNVLSHWELEKTSMLSVGAD